MISTSLIEQRFKIYQFESNMEHYKWRVIWKKVYTPLDACMDLILDNYVTLKIFVYTYRVSLKKVVLGFLDY